IAGTVLLLDPELTESLPLLFDFLGVPDPERRAQRMDPEARQRQLCALFTRLVQARSRREPSVLLVEDLHWVDGGSEGFLAELVVPPTVHSVLAARIDRLPEREKDILQTAAVIGKEFTERVLRAVSELAEADVRAALATLTRAEFIYEETVHPENEYSFKHPLTHEVAYRSQLGERRASMHAAAARAIAE